MDEQNTTKDPVLTKADEDRKKQLKRFKQGIDHCKRYRRKLISDWQINVDFRRGKPFASQSDEDRIIVPLDWSLTKEKEAQLWSQLPAVRLSHPPQTLAPPPPPQPGQPPAPDTSSWVHALETKINDTAVLSGAEAAVSECVVDCINASGIGVVIVSREAITETVDIPKQDLAIYPPEVQAQILETFIMPDGTPLEMIPTPNELDSRYLVSRVSPADFLWPLGFTGSDFDAAPWIGRSGRISWAEAVQRFKLEEKDKQKYVGEARSPDEKIDKIIYDTERVEAELYDETVEFNELFYKENVYNTAARSFAGIHHLVFIDGKDEPVIDELWKGQKVGDNNLILGATRYPIQVLTLTYITDDAIPPSDSAVGRPQVNEINKSRSQMIKQRERSIPVRWFDVNRVDPLVQHSLMRGTWQGMVPVQGVGSNILGEVARAQMSGDNYTFDKIAKDDFNRSTGMGAGLPENIETKAESALVGGAMQVRIAKERAKVGRFYTNIAEVLGGLLCIFEEPSTIGEGFDPVLSRSLAFSILADSTMLQDSDQRLNKLMQFINFTAKSGWVNIEFVLKEIAALSGLDPSKVIVPPQPKPPVEPNISLRLTGTEDLLNPLALAFTINSGQAPSVKMIEDAKILIQTAVTPPASGIPTPPIIGPDGLPIQQPINPMAQPPLGPPPEQAMPAPPAIGAAHPQWGATDRINARVVERAGESRND